MRLLILTICCLALGAQAQVFTLWPSGGGVSDNPLEAEIFSTEPVIINGVRCEMKLGLVHQDIHNLVISIQENFRDAKVAAKGNNLLVMMPVQDGWQQRYLYVSVRPGMPVLQVSMKIPEKIPDKFDWPRQLPILAHATPFRLMSFPKRQALYGAFRYDGTPTAVALEQMIAIASPDKWEPMAREETNLGRASGEILIRKNPPAIMLVNFTQEGVGFVYTRPLSK